MTNKNIVLIGSSALLVGALIGGLLVDRIKECHVVDNSALVWQRDSIMEESARKDLEIEQALRTVEDAEARIVELSTNRKPTVIRVRDARTKYHTSSTLEQLDSLLGSEPD